MKSRLLKSAQIAAFAMVPMALLSTAPAAAQSVVTPAEDISLSAGQGKLITIPGKMADIFISNPGVADVKVKSASQAYIFAKGGGTTTIYASNAAGDVIWSGTVRVGSNLDSVDTMLRLAMPEAKIAVATMGTDTFLLTGTISAPEDAAEAERLVQAFVGKNANVISRLKMATPLQVNLQVRFAEVSRSMVRDIGSNLTTGDGSSGFRFGLGNGRALTPEQSWSSDGPLVVGKGAGQAYFQLPDGTKVFGPAVDTTGKGSTIAGMGRLLGLDILGALDLAESTGVGQTLAEPNLTALSGETAEFLAGGEFPIPTSQGLGATAIQYRKYGVSLSYTPTVLANGRISLRVRPEVSELTSQGAVQLNGFSVPGLTVRRAETTVELGSGQSFMIAGLLNNFAQNTIDKTPGAGDIPILGSLFRSTSFRRGETELVIVVTPYLVNPVNANEIKLPTDGFNAPTELQRLFGNKASDGESGASRPMPTAAPAEAANPELSALSPDSAPVETKKSKARSSHATADAAKPGFSLN